MGQAVRGCPENECILCGRCMEVCPVLGCSGREEFGPRAKGLMALRLKESPDGLSLDKVRALASQCAGCDRCRSVCPQFVDIPSRMAALKEGSREWSDWLIKALYATAPLSMPILLKLGALGLGGGMTPLSNLRPWLRMLPPKPLAPALRVLLFQGCVARYGAPSWTANAIDLLGALGVEAEPADFGCCAFTLGKSGLSHDMDKAMERNVGLWREAGRPPVVAWCATCLAGLKDYAGQPGWSPGERELWLRRVLPLEALFEGARVEPDGLAPLAAIVVHRPCHAPPGASWIERAVAGVRELTVSTDCCGFGGTLQLTNRPLSRKIAENLWRKARTPEEGSSSGVQVLTGCSGCVLQLGATHPEGVATGHWLEVIRAG